VILFWDFPPRRTRRNWRVGCAPTGAARTPRIHPALGNVRMMPELPEPDRAREWGWPRCASPPRRGNGGEASTRGPGRKDRRLPAPLDRRGGPLLWASARALRGDANTDLHLSRTVMRYGRERLPRNRHGRVFGPASTGAPTQRRIRLQMFDLARDLWAATAIRRRQHPIAAGSRCASEYKGDRGHHLCTLGEDDSNQGTFGETLTSRRLWRCGRLPGYEQTSGMATRWRRHSASRHAQRKGEASGLVPGMRCDGTGSDRRTPVLARRFGECAKTPPAARRGELPLPRRQSMARPRAVRKKEDGRRWRARDPIRVRRDGSSPAADRRAERHADGSRGSAARGGGGGNAAVEFADASPSRARLALSTSIRARPADTRPVLG